MSRWQVTISHPSLPLTYPSLVLDCFNEDGYQRTDPNMYQIGDRNGADNLSLDHNPDKFLWTLLADLDEPDTEYLGALIRWQDETYKAGNDGQLTLTDEVRRLDPEVAPHSRTLINSTVTSYGMTTGWGVFPVKLSRTEGGPKILGYNPATGKPRYRVVFNAVEL